jgi:opacity protein-like surface antigen
MTFSIPSSIRSLIVASFALAVAAPVHAQEHYSGFAKQGGFVAFSLTPGFTFDGDFFDGETVYKEVDGEELAALPKLDKQPMLRGILGFRGRSASLELSYERTQHEGSFFGETMNATFQAVNVNGRYFFAPNSRVQPHVLAGGSIPWLRVQDGSVLDPNAEELVVGDGRWRGYGVNTEVGVTVYPSRAFGIGVGYAYRLIWFDRASGASNKVYHMRPRFRETSSALSLTGTFVF